MAVHNHRNRCSCYHSKSNVVVDKSGSLPRKPRRSCNSPSLRPRAVLIAPQRMTSLLPEAYQPRLRVKSYQASLEHITRGKFTLSTNRFKSFEIDCLSLFLSLFFIIWKNRKNWPLFTFSSFCFFLKFSSSPFFSSLLFYHMCRQFTWEDHVREGYIGRRSIGLLHSVGKTQCF